MTNTVLNFAVFWGIWLLVPMLIDGVTYFLYLFGVWRAHISWRLFSDEALMDFFPDLVTVIVPVYNGQHTLGPCLTAILNQSYPQEYLQVLVINNGSTDSSHEVFDAIQREHGSASMTWLDIDQKGKVWALNTGIHLANGNIIMNVDCDTMLHKNAIRNMVRAFHNQSDLAAATGAIEVALPPDLLPWKKLWAGCEAIEYLAAFHIGRLYQTSNNSLFTLAGAFSCFRREILLETFLYDRETVAEDTKMTLDVREKADQRKMRIGCVPSAVALVEPTFSISKLYAQRVRWQRGELEVAALQTDMAARNVFKSEGLSIPRMLLIDHTLAFPRLIWTFLMPALYFLGYPLALVIQATIGLYFFYAAIEGLSMLTCYLLGSPDAKATVKEQWYLFIFMPCYRFTLFWFRFGGFLNVLTDQAQWHVTDPWEDTKAGFHSMVSSLRTLSWRTLLPKKLRKGSVEPSVQP